VARISPGITLGRREALIRLGALLGGALAACAPIRVDLHSPPSPGLAEDRAERTLRAFVLSVVPGMSESDPALARVLADPFYRFAGFRGHFAADLRRRARRLTGSSEFAALAPELRRAVIADGLDADPLNRRLYRGAVFLVQLACYSGIYDDRAGCALIGFPGAYGGAPPTYPDCGRFFARSASPDGNPA
jgi:hypothetical protein